MDAAKIRAGVTIFAASPASDEMVVAAKKYISDNGLTNEDVKLGTKDGTVMVVTIREVELKI